jgi:hypothetical protein
MATQPEGEDTTVPLDAHEVEIVGSVDGGRVSGQFPRSSELPKGLTFTFRKYQFVQLEASGDLSIMMTGVGDVPDWFSVGKVHRFAREALAICLHDDSRDPTVKKKKGGPSRAPKKRVSPLAGEKDTIGQRVPDRTGGVEKKKAASAKSGCMVLALGLPAVAALLAALL